MSATLRSRQPRLNLHLFLAAGLGLLLLALIAKIDGPAFWPIAVMLMISPLTEEIVFRAGIQETLQRLWRAPHMANLATALLFGTAHASVKGPAMALAILLPALLVGECYRRGLGLKVCVLLHAAMNAMWIFGFRDWVLALSVLV